MCAVTDTQGAHKHATGPITFKHVQQSQTLHNETAEKLHMFVYFKQVYVTITAGCLSS